MGQTARFERYMARLVYILAAGQRIDPDRAEPFAAQLDQVYANPFEMRQKQPETAAEIKDYILGKLEALLDGSDEAGRENRPGQQRL